MIATSGPESSDPLQQTEGAQAPAESAVCSRWTAFSRSLLSDGEIVLLELKPSLWFILLVSGPAIVLGVALLLVSNTNVAENLLTDTWRDGLRHVGLWVIGLRLGWAVLQWMGRCYVLTDRRVLRQRGVLNIQVFECALDRLQNTFIQRTLVQRILGIGNILFATAGTGAVEAMWQHVRDPGDVHRQVTRAITRYRHGNGGSP